MAFSFEFEVFGFFAKLWDSGIGEKSGVSVSIAHIQERRGQYLCSSSFTRGALGFRVTSTSSSIPNPAPLLPLLPESFEILFVVSLL